MSSGGNERVLEYKLRWDAPTWSVLSGTRSGRIEIVDSEGVCSARYHLNASATRALLLGFVCVVELFFVAMFLWVWTPQVAREAWFIPAAVPIVATGIFFAVKSRAKRGVHILVEDAISEDVLPPEANQK